MRPKAWTEERLRPCTGCPPPGLSSLDMGGGFLERQRNKLKARIDAAAGSYLEDGEHLREALYAIRQARVWPLALVAAGVSVVLALQRVELRSWVIGLLVGLYVAFGNRYYYLILTDRRLLFVRASIFSSTRTKLESQVSPTDVGSAVYADGILNGKLTLEMAGRNRTKLTVARPFRSEGERLAQQLAALPR